MESRLPRCCTRFSPIHQKFVDLSGSRQPQQFFCRPPPPVGGTKYSTSVMLRTCLHLYYEKNITSKHLVNLFYSFLSGSSGVCLYFMIYDSKGEELCYLSSSVFQFTFADVKEGKQTDQQVHQQDNIRDQCVKMHKICSPSKLNSFLWSCKQAR